MQTQPKTSLTADDCISEVQGCIDALRKKKLRVSDTFDMQGNQYVNLVQKGGGVLGIALVGYTYVLEAVGIRFLRLAGTSAGAINTALLAAVERPPGYSNQETKSKKILEILIEKNLFDFVDGHPFAQLIIRQFVTNKGFSRQLKRGGIWLGGALLLFLFADAVLLGFSHRFEWAPVAGQVAFMLTGLLLLLLGGVLFYVLYMLRRLRSRDYGINPGDEFKNWITGILDNENVKTVDALNARVAGSIPALHLSNSRATSTTDLKGDVTFITSELVTQNKIELPKMGGLFIANPGAAHPAIFVRASMAVPLFFEPCIIPNIPSADSKVQAMWKTYFGLGKDCIPATARLVDGGVLSNFPVNIFYNAQVQEPRLPVFGIDLGGEPVPHQPVQDTAAWSLGKYLSRLFDTLHGYYDKDFLLKNSVYQRGIGAIPLTDFNWLNFCLSDADKKKMFIRGAEAACEFLKKFDWDEYKRVRTDLPQQLQKNA